MTTLDLHQSGVDELLHVVREKRLGDPEQWQQLALADLRVAAAQHVQNLDTKRLGQCLGRCRDPLSVDRKIETRGRGTAVRRGWARGNGWKFGGNGHINGCFCDCGNGSTPPGSYQ